MLQKENILCENEGHQDLDASSESFGMFSNLQSNMFNHHLKVFTDQLTFLASIDQLTELSCMRIHSRLEVGVSKSHLLLKTEIAEAIASAVFY